ncbi:hypothetical protein [Streptomyces drozdowiczii]|uniref:hypothetical protein n=1 Tax=Streptomyces drozdowiczii TaxID=202862 RepID=UPI00403C0842
MSTSMFGPHSFFLIDEYDALPSWAQPNFLASTGLTHASIERLRALRAAAEGSREPAPESPRPSRSSQRRARSSRRRPRVAATRPRNRTDIRFTSRRRVTPTFVFVFIIERD